MLFNNLRNIFQPRQQSSINYSSKTYEKFSVDRLNGAFEDE